MMKKISVLALAAVAFMACGNKTDKGNGHTNDTSVVVTDSMTVVSGVNAEDVKDAEAVMTFNSKIIDKTAEEPEYEVAVYSDGKLIQTLKGNLDVAPNDWNGVGDVTVVDMDFDGHKDLMVFLGNYATNNAFAYYDAWCYDSGTGKYVVRPSFRDVSYPEVDEAEKTITGYYLIRDGSKRYQRYEWKSDGTITESGEAWNK